MPSEDATQTGAGTGTTLALALALTVALTRKQMSIMGPQPRSTSPNSPRTHHQLAITTVRSNVPHGHEDDLLFDNLVLAWAEDT